jgi:hypothetical protein
MKVTCYHGDDKQTTWRAMGTTGPYSNTNQLRLVEYGKRDGWSLVLELSEVEAAELIQRLSLMKFD